MESRTKNGVRNIYSAFVNQAISIVLPFIVRTVFIRSLGEQYLGLNSLFVSILNVLNLSELGFGSALVFSMYKPLAQNDTKKICQLLNAYKKIYRGIGVSIMIIGVLITPFVPKIIKGSVPSDINIYVLYLIYLFNASISYFVFAYKKALLKASQRSDIISNVATITTTITNLLQLLILIVIPNFYLYVIIYPIFTIIDNIIAAYYTKKLYPDIRCEGKMSKEDKQEMKKHVIGIAIQKFCSTSRDSFDNIVISLYLGLSTITMYNNYYYIMSAVHAVLYQIPNAIRASVGNNIAIESQEKNYKDFKTMNFIYIWIVGVCAICLLCLFQPFMNIWMGNKLMFSFSTVILICVYFYGLGMSDIISLYKDGAGLWWIGKVRTISEAICNLILNFVLGKFFGVNGIIFSSIITLYIIGLGYGGYIIFKGYFKSYSFLKYVIHQLGYMIATIFVGAIVYWICSLLHGNEVIILLIRLIICVGVTSLLFFFIYRKTEVFSEAKKFTFKIVSTFRRKSK